ISAKVESDDLRDTCEDPYISLLARLDTGSLLEVSSSLLPTGTICVPECEIAAQKSHVVEQRGPAQSCECLSPPPLPQPIEPCAGQEGKADHGDEGVVPGDVHDVQSSNNQ